MTRILAVLVFAVALSSCTGPVSGPGSGGTLPGSVTDEVQVVVVSIDTGGPVDGAQVRADFVDVHHIDPATGQQAIRASRYGSTGASGGIHLVATYDGDGLYAADRVYVTVSHEERGTNTANVPLRDHAAEALVALN